MIVPAEQFVAFNSNNIIALPLRLHFHHCAKIDNIFDLFDTAWSNVLSTCIYELVFLLFVTLWRLYVCTRIEHYYVTFVFAHDKKKIYSIIVGFAHAFAFLVSCLYLRFLPCMLTYHLLV